MELLCKQWPLDRIVLETDAGHLPVHWRPLNHPGNIPIIAARIAASQGTPGGAATVMAAARINTKRMHGI